MILRVWRQPYSARSSSCVFSPSAYRPSRSECRPCGPYPRNAWPSGSPAAHTRARRVACLLRRKAVGGPSGAVYSEWRDPGAFGCDAGTRAYAFCGDCSVGTCASFGVPYRTTGYGARCGGYGVARPWPGPADTSLRYDKITDILPVLQRWPGYVPEQMRRPSRSTHPAHQRPRNKLEQNAKISLGRSPRARPRFHLPP